MIGLVLVLAAAAAPVSSPLRTMLDDFGRSGDTAHAAQLETAITASPELTRKLGELAASGQLKGFALKPSGPRQFHAWREGGVICFTADFLDVQASFEPRRPDLDYSSANPNNLTFVFGFLASKLETAPELAAWDEKWKAEIRALTSSAPPGSPPDLTAMALKRIDVQLSDEARAFLTGWNAEVGAATAAKGAPLTVPEAFHLLEKGRNTTVLLRAAMLPSDQRIVPAPNFAFPVNDRNLTAVVSVLKTSGVPDFH